MTILEFKGLCLEIAEKLANEKSKDINIYRKSIDTLIKYLNENKINLDAGGLRLNRIQLKELTKYFKLRKPQNIPKGNCLVEILGELHRKNLYEGRPPSVPIQVERKTVMNLASTPFEKQESFDLVANALMNPSIRGDITPQGKVDIYLCEFIASAIYDGALTHDFHRAVMSIRFSDITLTPFTINMPLTAEDPASSQAENLAFFRYWLSPLSEMYFLRLLIFFLKYRKELNLQLEGDYVFPVSWRTKEKLAEFAGIFDRWFAEIAKERSPKQGALGIRDFRSLSIANATLKIPCFTASALRGQISCDSLHEWYLSGLDDVLSKAHSRHFRYSVAQDTGKDTNTVKDEIERIFAENKKFILSNTQFSTTMERLREVVDNLPRNLSKKDRLMAAKQIDAAISGLPKEGSDTPQRFLFNIQILGKWLAYLLRETDYDKETIKTRADMIWARFIFMLGNNAIHELTTDQIVEIIIRTYSAYDSKGISSVIRVFTDDLYDYQEAIFPEMAWESLPWGRSDLLYKENIRRSKPLVTFQMVRDALERISRKYQRKEAKRLRVALILGFFAGLRIVEISYLTAASLMVDGGYTLAIRESKTRSGTRNIRLSLLLHKDELAEVVEFFAEKRPLAESENKSDSGKYLFSDFGPEVAKKKIPVEIAKIFKQLGHKIRFHHLRHSFANWLLVRALASVRGLDFFPEHLPFLKKEEKLFSGPYLEYVRNLILGYGEVKKGRLSFAFIMPTLANIMGHYGPETTLTSYLHIVDWVYYLFVREGWNHITLVLDSPTVQSFVQLSYPSLSDSLKKLKGISPSVILSEQHKRLEKLISLVEAESTPKSE